MPVFVRRLLCIRNQGVTRDNSLSVRVNAYSSSMVTGPRWAWRNEAQRETCRLYNDKVLSRGHYSMLLTLFANCLNCKLKSSHLVKSAVFHGK